MLNYVVIGAIYVSMSHIFPNSSDAVYVQIEFELVMNIETHNVSNKVKWLNEKTGSSVGDEMGILGYHKRYKR